MSVWLILAIAGITYASRALALVVMPDPSSSVRGILNRIPAPLFASLAALSLWDGDGVAPATTLCAAVGALIAAPTRSLAWVLFGGVVGYGAGTVLLS